MTEVVSVRFKNKGKVYFFDPNGLTVSPGDKIIVETAKGMEYAECVAGNHQVDDSTVRPPLRPVLRLATPEDINRAQENHKREQEAFEVCRQKIEKHQLDMKLVDVEYNFEGNKILFFFTSDGRVDFRDLVRDLASIFKTRIELRQIGVRDEARMLGGLGICGKPFCCAQFLDDFQPVSIKMAKTQGLSLNPTKISGTCGRLMCCLKYEQDAYEELVKNVPKVDSFVETPAGKATVLDVNILRSTVRVRLEDQLDSPIRTFDASEVEVLGGKAKRAEYLAMKAQGKVDPPKSAPRFKKAVPASQPVEEPREISVSVQDEPHPQEQPRRQRRSGQKGGNRQDQPRSQGRRRQEPKSKGEQRREPHQPQGEAQGQGESKPRPSGNPRRRHRSRKPSNPGTSQPPSGQ